MTRRLLLLLLLGASIGAAQAQRPAQGQRPAGAPATLVGTVEDADSGASLIGATVAVWRDSSLVTGAITDIDGAFRIEGIRAGRYRIVASFVGYESLTRDTVRVRPGENDLGAFGLTPGAEMLEEVTVDAERSAIEVDIDRIVYNVADDPVVQGGSVSDVLETIPSVEVDVDGNVSLRGVSNVAILIDGRPAPVGQDFIAAYLQSLPSGAIERIEVLPNPSAKYDPEGIGGILNVVLKENTELGLGGALTVGGDSRTGADVTSLLTLGRGKWDLTATAGVRRDVRNSTGTRYRVNRFLDPETSLNQDLADESTRSSALLSFGAEYALSRTTTLTANANGGYRWSGGDELTAFMPSDGTAYDRLTDEEDAGLNGGLRFGLRWDADGQRGQQGGNDGGRRGGDRGMRGGGRGDRGGRGGASLGSHTLVAEMRLRASDDSGTDLYTEQDLSGVFLQEQTETDGNSTSLSFDVDYARPLFGSVRMEAGTRIETDRRASDRFFYEDLGDGWVLDPERTSLFDQSENSAALYTQLRGEVGDLGVQVGVRAEATRTEFEPDGGTAFSYDDAGLFPSVSTSYQLSPATVVRASYSRRINRPRSRFLDPTPSVDDPLNIRVGNPELLPEYTDAFEGSVLQILPFGSVSLTPYWRRTTDVIRRIEQIQPDGVTISTFENLDTSTSGGVEGVVSFSGRGTLDGLNGTVSLEGFRVVTDGSSVDSDLAADAFGWGGRLSLRYGVTPTTDLQANANYRAPMDTEQGRIGARQFVDLALSQRLSSHARLAVRLRDPFNTASFSSILDQPRLYQEFDRDMGRQEIGVTLTYVFGSATERDAQRANQQSAPQDSGVGDLDLD